MVNRSWSFKGETVGRKSFTSLMTTLSTLSARGEAERPPCVISRLALPWSHSCVRQREASARPVGTVSKRPVASVVEYRSTARTGRRRYYSGIVPAEADSRARVRVSASKAADDAAPSTRKNSMSK